MYDESLGSMETALPVFEALADPDRPNPAFHALLLDMRIQVRMRHVGWGPRRVGGPLLTPRNRRHCA
jgi:hypothetical protein